VFENRVLRRIFGPKRDEITGEWRNSTMRSLMICTAHVILFGGVQIENEMGAASSMYGGEERRIQGFGGET